MEPLGFSIAGFPRAANLIVSSQNSTSCSGPCKSTCFYEGKCPLVNRRSTVGFYNSAVLVGVPLPSLKARPTSAPGLTSQDKIFEGLNKNCAMTNVTFTKNRIVRALSTSYSGIGSETTHGIRHSGIHPRGTNRFRNEKIQEPSQQIALRPLSEFVFLRVWHNNLCSLLMLSPDYPMALCEVNQELLLLVLEL